MTRPATRGCVLQKIESVPRRPSHEIHLPTPSVQPSDEGKEAVNQNTAIKADELMDDLVSVKIDQNAESSNIDPEQTTRTSGLGSSKSTLNNQMLTINYFGNI